MTQETLKTRRQYSVAFKQRILDECAQPGASVAGVALTHGINANLVHKWRSQPARVAGEFKASPDFIPVPVGLTSTPSQAIRIEMTRGATGNPPFLQGSQK